MITSIVKENDRVILKRLDVSKIVRVISNKKIKLNKKSVFLNNLVGQKYGSSFKLQGEHLVKMCLEEVKQLTSREIVIGEDNVEISDNKNLLDKRENQKLNKEAILTMRDQGVAGEKIVEELTKNSQTFQGKTFFSKQKYLKKKSQVHLIILTLLPCNTRHLHHLFYSKGPLRLCNLRMDSLAQILNQGNVRSGGKFLVVDSASGLLIGAILERLAAKGLLVNLYHGTAPSRPALDFGYNFSKEELSILHDFPLYKFSSLKHLEGLENIQNIFVENKFKKMKKEKEEKVHEEEEEEEKDEEEEEEVNEGEEGNEDDGGNFDKEKKDYNYENCEKKTKNKFNKKTMLSIEERDKRRLASREKLESVKVFLQNKFFDGLLVCSKCFPLPLVNLLLPLLKPGHPFVVFSQFKEPLTECFLELRESKAAILLRLSDTWLRSYQILEDRTHPLVNMSGSGGFLLSGLRVI